MAELKWPLERLFEWLQHATNNKQLQQTISRRIQSLIVHSLSSVKGVIESSPYAFEIFGFDILLDEALKPWLLEVNGSPSLHPTDEHDFKLKTSLISDALEIIMGNVSEHNNFQLLQ